MKFIKNSQKIIGVELQGKTILFPQPLQYRSDIPVYFIKNKFPENFLEIIEELRETLPPKPKIEVEVEDGKIEYKLSDGLNLRPQYFFINNCSFKAFGELTYLYGIKEYITKKGEMKTKEVIDPVLVVRIINKNGVEERKLFRLAQKNAIIINNIPIILEFKTKMINLLPTLLDFGGVFEFLELNKSYDLKTIYWEVIEAIKKYVNLGYDPRLYYLLACAVVATYFIGIFNTFPHIYFLASFGEGKTRAGLTAVYLSRRGFVVTDPTESSFFRTAEALGATFLIDDLRKKAERFLHMSYKRGIKVPRIEKTKRETFILSLFEPFAPLFITDVELPKEVDLTRAIIIKMQKMPDPNPEKRDPTPDDFKSLRRKLYIAALTNFEKIFEEYENLAKKDLQIKGRDWEVWAPILTIASFMGGDVWQQVYNYALQNIEEKKMELYTTEREILAGIEELLIDELEQLLGKIRQKMFASDSKLQKFAEEYEKVINKPDEMLKFRVKLLKYILGNEVRFTAAQLLKYMKKILVKTDVNEEAPYSERQFERTYSTQKIGRKLVVMGIPTRRTGKKGERYKIVDRKLFINLCRKYNYEPRYDEVEELIKADVSDITDINFKSKAYVKSSNQSLFSEPFSKNQQIENQKVEEFQKRDLDNIPLNHKIMSVMSETSVPFLEKEEAKKVKMENISSIFENAKNRVMQILNGKKKEHYGKILDALISEGFCKTVLEVEQVLLKMMTQDLIKIKPPWVVLNEK